MKTLEAIQVITKAGMSITFNPDALENKLRLTIRDRNSTKQFHAILETETLANTRLSVDDELAYFIYGMKHKMDTDNS